MRWIERKEEEMLTNKDDKESAEKKMRKQNT